jgi:hypothetical protein
MATANQTHGPTTIPKIPLPLANANLRFKPLWSWYQL